MFAWELDFLRLLEGARTDFLVRLFEAVTIIGEELIIIFLVAITYFVFDKKLASRIFFITATSLWLLFQECFSARIVRATL